MILSCVRSNPNGQIGFLNNMQRLNVALSRARHLLVIVGDARTLTQRSSVWRRLHQSAVKVTGVEDLPRFARRA